MGMALASVGLSHESQHLEWAPVAVSNVTTAGLGEGSPEPLACRNSILPLGPLGMLTNLIHKTA